MQLSDLALLLLRIGLGTVFLVHGTAKRKLWKVRPSAQMPAGKEAFSTLAPLKRRPSRARTAAPTE